MENNTQKILGNQNYWMAYHQGYDPIYNASYEFGFVFVDEDEIDDDDSDLYDDEEEEILSLH